MRRPFRGGFLLREGHQLCPWMSPSAAVEVPLFTPCPTGPPVPREPGASGQAHASSWLLCKHCSLEEGGTEPPHSAHEMQHTPEGTHWPVGSAGSQRVHIQPPFTRPQATDGHTPEAVLESWLAVLLHAWIPRTPSQASVSVWGTGLWWCFSEKQQSLSRDATEKLGRASRAPKPQGSWPCPSCRYLFSTVFKRTESLPCMRYLSRMERLCHRRAQVTIYGKVAQPSSPGEGSRAGP